MSDESALAVQVAENQAGGAPDSGGKPGEGAEDFRLVDLEMSLNSQPHQRHLRREVPWAMTAEVGPGRLMQPFERQVAAEYAALPFSERSGVAYRAEREASFTNPGWCPECGWKAGVLPGANVPAHPSAAGLRLCVGGGMPADTTAQHLDRPAAEFLEIERSPVSGESIADARRRMVPCACGEVADLVAWKRWHEERGTVAPEAHGAAGCGKGVAG